MMIDDDGDKQNAWLLGFLYKFDSLKLVTKFLVPVLSLHQLAKRGNITHQGQTVTVKRCLSLEATKGPAAEKSKTNQMVQES